MSRTANPNDYLDAFLKQVEKSFDRYGQLYDLVVAREASSGSKLLTLRKSLTGDAAFRLGSLWEVFQHRWHIAAISRNQTQFISLKQAELEKGLRDQAKDILTAINPTYSVVPRSLTLSQIEALADPVGRNLGFADTATWVAQSKLHHDPALSAKVTDLINNPESASLLDLVKQVRNALAHGSTSSLENLNSLSSARGGSKIGLVGTHNSALCRGPKQIKDVNTYLHAWVKDPGTRRIGIFYARLEEVAETLRM